MIHVRIPYMKRSIAAAATFALALLLALAGAGCGSGSGGAVQWEQVKGATAKMEVHDLQFDAAGGELYVATNGRGVWRYDGSTFTPIPGPLDDSLVFSLQVKDGGGIFYAAAGDRGVWRCDGREWTDTGIPQATYELALDRERGVLYAGTNHAVWALEADTWSRLDLPDQKILSLATAPGGGLYAGTASGVWYLSAGGWSNTGGEIRQYEALSLVCDAPDGLLYAGTTKQGVWELRNGEWRQLPDGPFDNPVEALVYDQGLHLLLCGTRYGVWTYDGSLWVNTQGAAMEYLILSLAVDSAATTVYAGTFEDVGVWTADLTPLLK
jgi:ligand-binding sensor domain-containing protein